jgi:hypothetical protein
MSDQELLQFICHTAEERVKASGQKVKALDFYIKAAKCCRRVRKEVTPT